MRTENNELSRYLRLRQCEMLKDVVEFQEIFHFRAENKKSIQWYRCSQLLRKRSCIKLVLANIFILQI